MYGYSKSGTHTKEYILERIPEEEIFRKVFFPDGIHLNSKIYRSPFRVDSNPDCWFWKGTDRLFFIDMGSGLSRTHFDFIGLVEVTYNLGFDEALRFLYNILELDNLGIKQEIKKVCHLKKKLEPNPIITFYRNFQIRDKVYWYDNYGIDKKDLEEDKVKPVSTYIFTSTKGDKIIITPKDITYSYEEFDGESKLKKIYRPKAIKKAKWLTNLNQNHVGNINNLNYAYSQLVITKSLKDCIVLKKLGVNTIWLQNETVKPYSEDFTKIVEFFKEIVIWYDNDYAGIKGGNNLKEHLSTMVSKDKIRVIYLPIELLESNITDASDLRKEQGEEELLNYLTKFKIQTRWQQQEK